jgi:hypothetical protein
MGAAIDLTNLQAEGLAESSHKLLYRFVVCYCLVAVRGAIGQV